MKKTQALIVVGVVVLLVVGGLLLFKGATASPSCEGEGPCMLYFYADD
jgi:hypothetical protein